MKKCLLIAKSNLKKTIGQNIAIFSLLLLASLMLNLGLMLVTDYKANFIKQHKTLHAEDVLMAISKNKEEEIASIKQLIEQDKRTQAYSLDACLLMAGLLPYNNGEVNSNFIFLDKETALSKEIGKIEMIEEGTATSGIYLPFIYKTGQVQIGKTISLTISGKTIEYEVCGFFNSLMAGSHNCGLTEIVLTRDCYESLEASALVMPSTIWSIRIDNQEESNTYEAMLNSKVNTLFQDAYITSTSYNLVFSSRYISQMICTSIISAMAFLVLLIVLVVLSSNIINYIKENMKKLGILKATGYTSTNLRVALIIQFLGMRDRKSVV